MVLIITKFVDFCFELFSPRIINGLRCYIEHSIECYIKLPNKLKWLNKTLLCLVFSTHFCVLKLEETLFLMFDLHKRKT